MIATLIYKDASRPWARLYVLRWTTIQRCRYDMMPCTPNGWADPWSHFLDSTVGGSILCAQRWWFFTCRTEFQSMQCRGKNKRKPKGNHSADCMWWYLISRQVERPLGVNWQRNYLIFATLECRSYFQKLLIGVLNCSWFFASSEYTCAKCIQFYLNSLNVFCKCFLHRQSGAYHPGTIRYLSHTSSFC